MPAVGDARAPGQGRQTPQASSAHQPLDPRAAQLPAVATQHRMYPRRAIGPAALGVDPPDILSRRRLAAARVLSGRGRQA